LFGVIIKQDIWPVGLLSRVYIGGSNVWLPFYFSGNSGLLPEFVVSDAFMGSIFTGFGLAYH